MLHYAHPEVLVNTQWVADHLSDPNIRLVEGNVGSQAYDDGHIPGAIFWNVFNELIRIDNHTNLDPVALEGLLARSGIANDTTVIAYGEHPVSGAWIFWLLKLFGHRDVRVLNGGRRKWIAL